MMMMMMMMMMEMVFETLVQYRHHTQLIAREDYINIGINYCKIIYYVPQKGFIICHNIQNIGSFSHYFILYIYIYNFKYFLFCYCFKIKSLEKCLDVRGIN